VLVKPGRGAGVRRWAEEVTPGPDGDVAVMRYSDAEGLAAWLVGYGADVVVLDPPEVRDAAVARLREIAAVHEAAAAAGTPGAQAAPQDRDRAGVA
jgi:proteasome accessory factor B